MSTSSRGGAAELAVLLRRSAARDTAATSRTDVRRGRIAVAS